MEEALSKISREDYHEWLTLPCTRELVKRLQYEEEAYRTALGSGVGIRQRDIMTAAGNAIEFNARADALFEFRKNMSYDNVISEDRKEVESVEERKDLEEDSEGENVQPENSWASPARQAIRNQGRGNEGSDSNS